LIRLRRLVVLSILLIIAGLALLLPSSSLYSLITKGTASSSTPSSGAGAFRFVVGATASTTSNTSTIESVVGFGLIAVGAVFELLSLITDVPGAPSTVTSAAEPEVAQPVTNPTPATPPTVTLGEKKK
jgi:hypothetical protein